MLIPGCDPVALEAKIEAMRNVVKLAGESTPEPCVLSLSVGVATYPEDGSDAEELLAESDRRMYKSKRLRKKSLTVAEPAVPVSVS
jgi:GGDEF domain-containing protein